MDELLQRARNGDTFAEQELLKRLIERFYRFAAQKVGRDDARDIAQNTCIVIHRKYRTEEFTISFEAWCHGVYKKVLLKHMSKSSKSPEEVLPFEIDTPDEHREFPDPFLRRMILQCLGLMKAKHGRYFEILRGHHDGKSIEELVSELKCTRNQVDVSLFRARQNLRKCLEGKGAFA